MAYEGHHAGLITMDDLSNEEILSILDDAQRLLPVAEGKTYLPLLQGNFGNLFFEPSTRTRMSFETAMKRLGGDVVNLGDVKTSSVVKGETLFDTIQMVDGYTDIIAMRHPRQGAAQYAQDAARVPILNGGDGAGHHPRKPCSTSSPFSKPTADWTIESHPCGRPSLRPYRSLAQPCTHPLRM